MKRAHRLSAALLVSTLVGGFLVVGATPSFAGAVGASQWHGWGVTVCNYKIPAYTYNTTECVDPVSGVHVLSSTQNPNAIDPPHDYECVDLARRYWHLAGWVGSGGFSSPAVNGAADLWNWAHYNPSKAIQEPNGSGYVPAHGDLIVDHHDSTGHVVVVDYATASGSSWTIHVMEQNWSSSSDPNGNAAVYTETNGWISRTTAGSMSSTVIYGAIHSASPTAQTIATFDDGDAVGIGVNPTNDHRYAFWRGGDNHIYEAFLTQSGGTWSASQDMYALHGGAWQTIAAPSVAVDNNDVQYVAWLNPQGTISEATYANNTWSAVATLNYQSASAPALGVNPTTGDQYIFWTDKNGSINEAWNSTGRWQTANKGWLTSTAPSVAVDNGGHQYVVYRGKTNSNIYQVVYRTSWSSPVAVGPPNDTTHIYTSSTRPTIALNPTSDNEILYWTGATNNRIYKGWQSAGNWVQAADMWSSENMSTSTDAAPSLGMDNSDHEYVYFRGATNSNIYEVTHVGSAWTGPDARWVG